MKLENLIKKAADSTKSRIAIKKMKVLNPGRRIGAIAIESTEDYGGDILSLGLVDDELNVIIDRTYGTSDQWDPVQVQNALNTLDFVLAYDLFHVKKTLESAGIVFDTPLVYVKKYHLKHLGGDFLIIDVITGEQHRSFDYGKNAVDTARNTIKTFANLPREIQREAIDDAPKHRTTKRRGPLR